MHNFTFAPIGSVVSGTHALKDLIEALVPYAMALARKDTNLLRASAAKNTCADIMDLAVKHQPTDEEAQELNELVHENLFNVLDSYALPFTYFGAHPGDASDFGFWASDDAMDDGVREQILYKGSFLPGGDIARKAKYLLKEENCRQTLIAVPSGIVLWTI